MNLRLHPAWHMLSLCLLSACAVGPNPKTPETQVGAQFDNKNQGGYVTAPTVAQWWRRYNDPKLNSLVDRAIASNLDLKIAAARVEEARALRAAVRYDYFPTVTSAASYTNQRQSKAASSPGLDRTSELYDAGLDASWELDFWGRVRRSNWAARADVRAAEAAVEDGLVLVTAEVASTYLELRGLQHQLAVRRRNADNQQQTLKLTESLLQGGRGTELDTSRARAQLNSTLAAIPLIEGLIAQDIHRLSVLIGTTPSTLKPELIKPRPIPTLPSIVRIGNPSELLRRRPDIRAVEADLEAATHRVGVATADLFPRVTFNGTASLQADSFSGPWSGANSFGPRISWAAFDLGRVKAQINAANARVDAQVSTYYKTVLGALEETENALVTFGRQRARRNYLSESATASEQAANLARERYQNGVADFLTVLDAERVLLEAQSLLAESQTATATSQVAIYKALGGGWEGIGASGRNSGTGAAPK
ncbi:efflux transporter outer membrane subunit [Verrucomicrobium spinosum]|uniref:efflux transporter outer membrane subunit n=1 Tax=Verrucomicrobium spinosum TaxID=2736 RepID=UPI0001745336|nr:efflux transporter outer membrane subunit [Verrucomicrobium spinosum]